MLSSQSSHSLPVIQVPCQEDFREHEEVTRGQSGQYDRCQNPNITPPPKKKQLYRNFCMGGCIVVVQYPLVWFGLFPTNLLTLSLRNMKCNCLFWKNKFVSFDSCSIRNKGRNILTFDFDIPFFIWLENSGYFYWIVQNLLLFWVVLDDPNLITSHYFLLSVWFIHQHLSKFSSCPTRHWYFLYVNIID
jgi:hypothetical protein